MIRRRRDEGGDCGSAIVEFVFVALVAMVPLVYLLVAVAMLQRTQTATASAARQAGRAFATAADTEVAVLRARVAVRLALAAHGLPDDATVRYVAANAACSSGSVVPSVAPGAEFTICVQRNVSVPGVPGVLAGRGVMVVGAYVVHIDDYRSGDGS